MDVLAELSSDRPQHEKDVAIWLERQNQTGLTTARAGEPGIAGVSADINRRHHRRKVFSQLV